MESSVKPLDVRRRVSQSDVGGGDGDDVTVVCGGIWVWVSVVMIDESFDERGSVWNRWSVKCFKVHRLVFSSF